MSATALLRAKRAAEEEEENGSSTSPQPAKRQRLSSESEEQVLFRHGKRVERPGIPNPIRLSAFRLPDKPSPPLRGDDKEGHYVYELGENISSRYKILSKFGEGTFGRVLECWDRRRKEYVAVKIVRNVDKYRHAAMIELEVLNTLESNDPLAKRKCVHLKEWFDYRGHVCMVFEKLGPSLYDFLRRNDYQPFPLAVVQSVARQLLEAVAFMHELRLVHTDLKPENILLRGAEYMRLPPVEGTAGEGGAARPHRRVPRVAEIRVIDFGSATFEDGYHSSVVSTRHYRAPEVILGLGWSFPCDLWSAGCILVELATGDALFQTHENLEHLAMMQQVLGPVPESMAYRADKHSAKYFTGGRLDWPEGAASRKSVRAVNKLRDLQALLSERCDTVGGQGVEELVDLVKAMLQYEPSQRMSAAATLSHPFLTMELPAPPGVLGGGAALMDPTPEPALPAVAAAAGVGGGAEAGPAGDGGGGAAAAQQQQQPGGGDPGGGDGGGGGGGPLLEAAQAAAAEAPPPLQQQQPGPPLGWPPGGREGRLEAAEAAGQTGDVGA
ncbi:MAG: kinase-like domain-containing protein [Monoraphidium minutum]|nr:MAG: kinase-like domain-containing protein [Monoraphidium minutum]